MSFGVSGNIGASSSRIYSNPKTMEAVRRVNGSAPKLTEGQRFILRLRAQKARKAEVAGEMWRDEFLRNIYQLRDANFADRAKQWENTQSEIVRNFRSLSVIHTPMVERPVQPVRPRAEVIIREGCFGTGFTIEDVKGGRRNRELIRLRHSLIAKVYRECPDMSTSQIGKAFGGLDHTTVLNAVKKMGAHYSQTGDDRQFVDHRRKAA